MISICSAPRTAHCIYNSKCTRIATFPIFLESFQPSSPSSDSNSVPFVARIRHVLGGSGLGSFCKKGARAILRRCLNFVGRSVLDVVMSRGSQAGVYLFRFLRSQPNVRAVARRPNEFNAGGLKAALTSSRVDERLGGAPSTVSNR